MSHTEIERKWLMAGYPPLAAEDECLQQQAYLSLEPVTVRIRKTKNESGTSYTLTIKGKGTLARTEVETPLTQTQYEALLPLAILPAAQKRLRHYRLPGGHTLEASWVDEEQPTAFYYAEVEFASEAEARAFAPPAFLGREVTEQPGYTMLDYCRYKQRPQGPNHWRQP